MADNSSALAQGTKIMKNIITADIMQRLNRASAEAMNDIHERFFPNIPGMTGNAKTSNAAATYNKGKMETILIRGKNMGGVRMPLQHRITKGEKFHAGQKRYDGPMQGGDYKGSVSTTREYIQIDHDNFLESQQSGTDFKMILISGTEYFPLYDWTTLQHDNYTWFLNNVDSFFK